MRAGGVDSRDGFESLTPRERECLRLVARHHRSKEIARLLNISKSTVDKHIDRARERLGSADRRAAALALIEWERGMGIEYPPDPVPISPDIDTGSSDRSPPTAIRKSRDDQRQMQTRPADDDALVLDPGVPDELGGAGSGPGPSGQPGQGGPDSDRAIGPAPAAVLGSAGEAAGPDPQRHGLDHGRRRALRPGGGVHDLTPLQILSLVALTAILGSLLLGGVLMGAQEVALLVQRIIDGILPRGG
ncbi:MAG: helix-turn-helix transcriptional regulator [Caulobacter sp.]|nr:helix-turn-helix transcriptional regulator [Caulobacter sp.]